MMREVRFLFSHDAWDGQVSSDGKYRADQKRVLSKDFNNPFDNTRF